MGTSPDQLRSQIESTRARLAEDLDHLASRLSPRRAARRRGERMRGVAHGLRGRLRGGQSHGAEPNRSRSRNRPGD